jgi:hypothetical protein
MVYGALASLATRYVLPHRRHWLNPQLGDLARSLVPTTLNNFSPVNLSYGNFYILTKKLGRAIVELLGDNL